MIQKNMLRASKPRGTSRKCHFFDPRFRKTLDRFSRANQAISAVEATMEAALLK